MHKTQKLTLTALFAALSYAVFTFLQIKIPIGADATSIHLGNAVVVIAALVLGGPLGGFAGALGMTIGDLLDPVYITYAPKTLICKMVIPSAFPMADAGRTRFSSRKRKRKMERKGQSR